jgi:hypothetical protein
MASPPRPPILFRSPRQIGMNKWMLGALTLMAYPTQNECWVAEHYTGYNYILERSDTPEEFLQKTFHNDRLVNTETMRVPNQNVPVFTDVVNLLNKDDATAACTKVLVALTPKKIETPPSASDAGVSPSSS